MLKKVANNYNSFFKIIFYNENGESKSQGKNDKTAKDLELRYWGQSTWIQISCHLLFAVWHSNLLNQCETWYPHLYHGPGFLI